MVLLGYPLYSETGGATVTKPDNGFDGTGLEALFSKRSTKLSSATPSANSNSSNLSGGAIAGITVGVVAAVAIAIAALVFFLIARKRRRDQAAAIQNQKDRTPLDPRDDTYTNPAELEGKQTANEMGTKANIFEKPPDRVIVEAPATELAAVELSAETPRDRSQIAETDGAGARN